MLKFYKKNVTVNSNDGRISACNRALGKDIFNKKKKTIINSLSIREHAAGETQCKQEWDSVGLAGLVEMVGCMARARGLGTQEGRKK